MSADFMLLLLGVSFLALTLTVDVLRAVRL